MALILFWSVPTIILLIWLFSLWKRSGGLSSETYNAYHRTQWNGNRGVLIVPVLFVILVFIAVISANT